MTNILAFIGSPRRGGNSDILTQYAAGGVGTAHLAFRWASVFVAVAVLLVASLGDAEPAGRQPWGAIIKVELDKRTVTVGQTSTLTVKVTKEPVVTMTYWPPPAPFTDERAAKLEGELQLLAKSKCNALCLPWNGDPRLDRESHERFIDLAHGKGFSVLLLPLPGRFPGAEKFLEEHPEARAVDQHGNRAGFCVNSPVLRARFRDWMEKAIPRNADAMGLDEPVYPGYTDTYKKGNLYCYCPVCKSKFRERYGIEMPHLKLPEDRTAKAELWKKVLEFRRDSMTDWMDFFHRRAKEIVPGLCTVADFYSDNVSQWIPPGSGWHCTVGDAQAMDVEKIIALPSIDCVYMNTNSARDMRRSYKHLFVDVPHRHNKFAHFFTGYLEPYAMPDEVTRQLDAAMDSGAEGIALWSPWVCWVDTGDRKKYWAREEKYGLEDYLGELSRAVEVHKDTPVEDAVIVLQGCGVEMRVEGGTGGIGSNGSYEILLKAQEKGQIRLAVQYLGRQFRSELIRVE